MIIGGSCAFFLPDDRTGHSLSETDIDVEKINLRANILTPEMGSTTGTGPVSNTPEINPILEFHFKDKNKKLKSSGIPYTVLPLEDSRVIHL